MIALQHGKYRGRGIVLEAPFILGFLTVNDWNELVVNRVR